MDILNSARCYHSLNDVPEMVPSREQTSMFREWGVLSGRPPRQAGGSWFQGASWNLTGKLINQMKINYWVKTPISSLNLAHRGNEKQKESPIIRTRTPTLWMLCCKVRGQEGAVFEAGLRTCAFQAGPDLF